LEAVEKNDNPDLAPLATADLSVPSGNVAALEATVTLLATVDQDPNYSDAHAMLAGDNPAPAAEVTAAVTAAQTELAAAGGPLAVAVVGSSLPNGMTTGDQKLDEFIAAGWLQEVAGQGTITVADIPAVLVELQSITSFLNANPKTRAAIMELNLSFDGLITVCQAVLITNDPAQGKTPINDQNPAEIASLATNYGNDSALQPASGAPSTAEVAGAESTPAETLVTQITTDQAAVVAAVAAAPVAEATFYALDPAVQLKFCIQAQYLLTASDASFNPDDNPDDMTRLFSTANELAIMSKQVLTGAEAPTGLTLDAIMAAVSTDQSQMDDILAAFSKLSTDDQEGILSVTGADQATVSVWMANSTNSASISDYLATGDADGVAAYLKAIYIGSIALDAKTQTESIASQLITAEPATPDEIEAALGQLARVDTPTSEQIPPATDINDLSITDQLSLLGSAIADTYLSAEGNVKLLPGVFDLDELLEDMNGLAIQEGAVQAEAEAPTTATFKLNTATSDPEIDADSAGTILQMYTSADRQPAYSFALQLAGKTSFTAPSNLSASDQILVATILDNLEQGVIEAATAENEQLDFATAIGQAATATSITFGPQPLPPAVAPPAASFDLITDPNAIARIWGEAVAVLKENGNNNPTFEEILDQANPIAQKEGLVKASAATPYDLATIFPSGLSGASTSPDAMLAVLASFAQDWNTFLSQTPTEQIATLVAGGMSSMQAKT
ncbi:MAG TPA: hypothetical protein VJJ83_00950, partial [Candidatus Babeliales bacterium]|nr:hypothetical protein [Candidatus Babeliales bacterium]